MNDERSNPVPNLNREELNTKLNEPRQEKEETEQIASRRAFFGRLVAGMATLAAAGWLSGCGETDPELNEPPEYDVIKTDYDVIETPASTTPQ